jgi:hypothetical protein
MRLTLNCRNPLFERLKRVGAQESQLQVCQVAAFKLTPNLNARIGRRCERNGAADIFHQCGVLAQLQLTTSAALVQLLHASPFLGSVMQQGGQCAAQHRNGLVELCRSHMVIG